MEKKKNNLKEIFQDLDDILKKLEVSDLDIDKMVELYEQGMALTKICKSKIEDAEQRIEVINNNKDLDKDSVI
tara:strand:+ start:4422 stop:4640 length:219 start_codon:yes stop_codon:yes gene_type:complete